MAMATETETKTLSIFFCDRKKKILLQISCPLRQPRASDRSAARRAEISSGHGRWWRYRVSSYSPMRGMPKIIKQISRIFKEANSGDDEDEYQYPIKCRYWSAAKNLHYRIADCHSMFASIIASRCRLVMGYSARQWALGNFSSIWRSFLRTLRRNIHLRADCRRSAGTGRDIPAREFFFGCKTAIVRISELRICERHLYISIQNNPHGE